MFNVYQHYVKEGQSYMPYIATFAQKSEAEWYAREKLRANQKADYMVIREKNTGMKWEINQGDK